MSNWLSSRKSLIAAALIASGVSVSGAALAHAATFGSSNDTHTFTVPATTGATDSLRSDADGSDSGGDTTARQKRGHSVAELATALGVGEEQLRAALDSIAQDNSGHLDRSQFNAKLAEALGIEQSAVDSALAATKGGAPGNRAPGEGRGHGRGLDAQALADALGVSVEKVTSALEELKPAEGARPDPAQFAAKLATALGVDEAQVQEALKSLRPEHARPMPSTSGDEAAGGEAPGQAAEHSRA